MLYTDIYIDISINIYIYIYIYTSVKKKSCADRSVWHLDQRYPGIMWSQKQRKQNEMHETSCWIWDMNGYSRRIYTYMYIYIYINILIILNICVYIYKSRPNVYIYTYIYMYISNYAYPYQLAELVHEDCMLGFGGRKVAAKAGVKVTRKELHILMVQTVPQIICRQYDGIYHQVGFPTIFWKPAYEALHGKNLWESCFGSRIDWSKRIKFYCHQKDMTETHSILVFCSFVTFAGGISRTFFLLTTSLSTDYDYDILLTLLVVSLLISWPLWLFMTSWSTVPSIGLMATLLVAGALEFRRIVMLFDGI